MERRIIAMHHEPPAYTSHAVRAGDFLYISGLIGIDYSTGTLAGMNAEDEFKQITDNLKDILKAEGIKFDSIVKTTLLLTSMRYLTEINRVYSKCFTHNNYPARELAEVQMLPKNAKVEMSSVAYIPPKKPSNEGEAQKKKGFWG
jgi:2-iminobutanoate/2-iminopropanoate deaminase